MNLEHPRRRNVAAKWKDTYTIHLSKNGRSTRTATTTTTTEEERRRHKLTATTEVCAKSVAGGYERFEHSAGVSTADLVSPTLCGNAETYVEFSCKIITPGFTFGRPAELHVLVTCNDVELRHQPLHGVRGPWTSWKPFNWTLPACPKGQTPRVSNTTNNNVQNFRAPNLTIRP